MALSGHRSGDDTPLVWEDHVDATDLIALVLGVLLGLGAGWLLWRGRRDALERAEDRLASARRRLDAAEADRLAISGQALELQRALRAERSLLDGVAAQAGIAPYDLRRTLAKDVLHLADPYRDRYLDEPIEADRRVGHLTKMKLGTRPMLASAELLGEHSEAFELELAGTGSGSADRAGEDVELADARAMLEESESQLSDTERALREAQAAYERRSAELDSVIYEARIVAGELAETERALVAAEATIRLWQSAAERTELGPGGADTIIDLRHPAGSDAGPVRTKQSAHWSDATRRVESLREEIAVLRTKLADRALESDQLTSRVARQAELESMLDHVADELGHLRDQVTEKLHPSGE